MKIILSMLVASILCLSCTSEEKKAEDLAVQSAKEDFQKDLREEMAKSITGKAKVQFTAVDILTQKTEFEITKRTLTENQGDFDVQAKTVPNKVRGALFEIISRLDEKKERSFNVPDALKLIWANLGLATDETSTLFYKIKLKKTAGEWRKIDTPK
jgi:hypothetical protein